MSGSEELMGYKKRTWLGSSCKGPEEGGAPGALDRVVGRQRKQVTGGEVGHPGKGCQNA